jgi:hypothetical protein
MGYADELFGSYDLTGINPQLVAENRRLAGQLGIRSMGITAGKNDHSLMTTSGNVSRHSRENALDIGSFNGYPVTSSEGASLAAKFAAAAEAMGYTRNHESGNPRAVLYGFNDPARGGNHHNHVHVSYRPDLDTGGGTMLNRGLSNLMTGRPASQSQPLWETMLGSTAGPLLPGYMGAAAGRSMDEALASYFKPLVKKPGNVVPNPQPGPVVNWVDLYNRAKQIEDSTAYNPFAHEQYVPGGGEASSTSPYPGDLDEYTDIYSKSLETASPEDVNARLLRAKQAAMQAYGENLDKIPVYHESDYSPQAYPALNLPKPTPRQAPRLDPMAGALAAIAGLVSPQYAGAFGAEPLQAGMADSERRYQDSQREDAENLQRLMVKHQDAIQQREDAIRADTMNRGIRRSNSEAERQALMEKALRAFNSDSAGREAEVYDTAGKVNGAARKAGIQAGAMKLRMDARTQQAAEGAAKAERLRNEANALRANDLQAKALQMQIDAQRNAERPARDVDADTARMIYEIAGRNPAKARMLAKKFGLNIRQLR